MGLPHDTSPTHARLLSSASQLLAAAHEAGGESYASALPGPVNRSDGRPLQVLIVEDAPAIAERLADIVSRPGKVEVAATAETEDEALKACDAKRFDLAIIDLQLAEGTGFAVVRRLRSEGMGRPYVVVLTNHALPALESASFQAGADLFLDKSKHFGRIGMIVDALAATS
jgi:two-component system, OmpR family, response regulator